MVTTLPLDLKSISTPDRLDTHIGKLDFSDGVPTGNTIKALYDNLDRSRGFQVYLDNLGAVAIRAFLSSLAAQGADAPNKIAIFEQLMDSQSMVLTANTSTLYAFSRTDLAKRRTDRHRGATRYARLPGRRLAAICRRHWGYRGG